MSRRRFFDTNVLVYFFDYDEPAKQRRAQEIIEGSREQEMVLSTQVLKELFVALTRKLNQPLTGDLALAALRRFSVFPVVSLNPSMLIEGAEVSIRHQISFWDALILVAARSASCDVVISEDLQHGWKVLDLEIQNPFADL